MDRGSADSDTAVESEPTPPEEKLTSKSTGDPVISWWVVRARAAFWSARVSRSARAPAT